MSTAYFDFRGTVLYPQAANDTPLSTICIVVIFFISGLKLKTADVKRALKNKKVCLFKAQNLLVDSTGRSRIACTSRISQMPHEYIHYD